MPRWAVNRRVAMLGLAPIKELEWNPAEVIEDLRQPRFGNERHFLHRDRILAEQGIASHCQERRASVKTARPGPGDYRSGEAVVTAAETIARNGPYKHPTAATNTNADEPGRR